MVSSRTVKAEVTSEPIPIGVAELRALDAEIRSVFDAGHVITPDEVRGSRATLAEAIQADGWPRLRAARGKVLFALDNTDQHRTDYLHGNPSLEGRVLFVSSAPGEPSAAFIKMNEALGEDEERIRQRVKGRFLIRTRADIPTAEARSGNTTRRDSAFRSGAHYVSTDYPEAEPFRLRLSGEIARRRPPRGALQSRQCASRLPGRMARGRQVRRVARDGSSRSGTTDFRAGSAARASRRSRRSAAPCPTWK